MKKSVKVLIGIILVLALGAAGTFGYFYFSKDKPNDDIPETKNPDTADAAIFECDDRVATVNGVSIIADDTGVRVFNEADETQKFVFNDPAESVAFNGEIAYFAEKEIEDAEVTFFDDEGIVDSQNEYGPWLRAKIHSYNLKTNELKEVVLTNNNLFTEIVYADDSAVYYIDGQKDMIGYTFTYGIPCSFYKYDFESQKEVLLFEDINNSTYCVEDGKMFYQLGVTPNGYDGYCDLYVFDFVSEKSNKISDDEALFLKLEGNKVYYIERTFDFNVSDEIEYRLMSNSVSGNNAETVAELDFLPDETKLSASYTDENTIVFVGRFGGEYLYDTDSKSFKYNEETKSDEFVVFDDGSKKIVEKTMYSDDDEGLLNGSNLYIVNGEDYKLLIELDPNTYVSKVTGNGVYTYTDDVDKDIPVKIEFIPLEIK